MPSQCRTAILKWSVVSLIFAHRYILLASLGMILLSPRSAAAQHADRVVDVTTTPLQPVCVTDTWAVWKTMELIEKTRGHRVESFVHTYYRQRLSEPKASLAATVNETLVLFATSIMQDGTLVLCHRNHLSLYLPDGTAKTYPEYLPVVAAYPDGILLQDTTGLKPKPVCFVPLRDHDLDLQEKVEIIPAPVLPDPHSDNYVAMTYAWKKVPLRHGDTLAWITDSVLHCYHLRDGKRSQTPLAIPGPHPFQRITAFDGATVVAIRSVFDARTGRYVYEDPQRPPFLHSTIALHDQCAYFFQNGHLMVADLAAHTSPKKLVDVKQFLAVETDKGLVVWDGKKWDTVPWLERGQKD